MTSRNPFKLRYPEDMPQRQAGPKPVPKPTVSVREEGKAEEKKREQNWLSRLWGKILRALGLNGGLSGAESRRMAENEARRRRMALGESTGRFKYQPGEKK